MTERDPALEAFDALIGTWDDSGRARRFAPAQPRHAHPVEIAPASVSPIVIGDSSPTRPLPAPVRAAILTS
jgi:hypothetical protein